MVIKLCSGCARERACVLIGPNVICFAGGGVGVTGCAVPVFRAVQRIPVSISAQAGARARTLKMSHCHVAVLAIYMYKWVGACFHPSVRPPVGGSTDGETHTHIHIHTRTHTHTKNGT